MHVPVLVKEVLYYLNVEKGRNFVDATFGNGGHTLAILKANSRAKVLGIDLDQASLDKLRIELVQDGLDQRCNLVSGNYKDIEKILKRNALDGVDGIIVDLGFSSNQVDASNRGFSFQTLGPLDMRYDQGASLTAEEVVNYYRKEDLERLIREYGEDRFYRQMVRSIIEARKVSKIKTTAELAKLIPHPDGRRRLFQALRIEVNHELDNLKEFLPKVVRVLNPGGRIVIISFHSLEDRIVKYFFKESGLKVLTKKVVRATQEEIISNSRSKSAKLRAAEKISEQ